MTAGGAALLLVVLGALVVGYLVVRERERLGEPDPWPDLVAPREPGGGGRDFGTMALARALEAARSDPATARRTTRDLHRQLTEVVAARLRDPARPAGADPALEAFLLADPDTLDLTDRTTLDALLRRIDDTWR